jgi:hypothetical protein
MFITIAFQLWFRISYYEGSGKQVGLKLYGTHQLWVYGAVDDDDDDDDDDDTLGGRINT